MLFSHIYAIGVSFLCTMQSQLLLIYNFIIDFFNITIYPSDLLTPHSIYSMNSKSTLRKSVSTACTYVAFLPWVTRVSLAYNGGNFITSFNKSCYMCLSKLFLITLIPPSVLDVTLKNSGSYKLFICQIKFQTLIHFS